MLESAAKCLLWTRHGVHINQNALLARLVLNLVLKKSTESRRLQRVGVPLTKAHFPKISSLFLYLGYLYALFKSGIWDSRFVSFKLRQAALQTALSVRPSALLSQLFNKGPSSYNRIFLKLSPDIHPMKCLRRVCFQFKSSKVRVTRKVTRKIGQ